MPNWCSNMVVFQGTENTIKKVGKLFCQLAKTERKTNRGQLPAFITEEKDWFFDIDWDGNVLFYVTRWVPNILQLIQVADHFGCGFVCEYEENGCLVYGRATYMNGLLNDVALDKKDFKNIEQDWETYTYRFEGRKYAEISDIFEILLKRKLKP